MFDESLETDNRLDQEVPPRKSIDVVSRQGNEWERSRVSPDPRKSKIVRKIKTTTVGVRDETKRNIEKREYFQQGLWTDH